MNTISTGAVNHIALTVTNRERSRDFYTSLLGFKMLAEFGPKYLLGNGSVILALAPAPDANRKITGDHFDENRIGLDHVSLNVANHAELEEALKLFNERDVPHGEIKDLGGLGIYVLAFRDPDNIQVELTAPKE
jgi:catechol 2,3-dioxygenase-like lactoylglutathione lyase family enzyme